MRRWGGQFCGKDRGRSEEKVDATTRMSESNLEKKSERICENGKVSFGSLVRDYP